MFPLAALVVAASEWSIVGVFAAFATCAGAVKLGLETYKEIQDIREKQNSRVE